MVIDHDGGLATLYGHQSHPRRPSAGTSTPANVIGCVDATGPHLHFEVRLGGNPVDPTSYIS